MVFSLSCSKSTVSRADFTGTRLCDSRIYAKRLKILSHERLKSLGAQESSRAYRFRLSDRRGSGKSPSAPVEVTIPTVMLPPASTSAVIRSCLPCILTAWTWQLTPWRHAGAHQRSDPVAASLGRRTNSGSPNVRRLPCSKSAKFRQAYEAEDGRRNKCDCRRHLSLLRE